MADQTNTEIRSPESMATGESPQQRPAQPQSPPPPHADRSLANRTILAATIKPPDLPWTLRDGNQRAVNCYYLTFVGDSGTRSPQRQIPCTHEVWRKIQREGYPSKFRVKFSVKTDSNGIAYQVVPNDEEVSDMKPTPDADKRNVVLRSYQGSEYQPVQYPSWITQAQLDEITNMSNQNPGYLQPGEMLLDKYSIQGITTEMGHVDVTVRVT